MKLLRSISWLVCCGALAGQALAEQPQRLLEGGSYEIAYRLELPHLERWAIDKTMTVCIADTAGASAAMLPIFSPNTPFAKCSAENLRRDGVDFSYDIVCAGRGAARATASYRVAPGAFSARIAMVMGAKNMTMTEVQTARRVGGCDLASASQR